ncbi:MAG: hypothetical protein ABS76_27055 [Pelagibacterium sp. SCN 64-44]|nr:MAG: hypothetical protein ABS76_27055 [Pelagibacterium sp. SCN 64-44]
MQLLALIAGIGPWAWVVAGLVLLALELVVPGGFLLWMGIAGICTGLIAFVQPIDWPWLWLIFGALSLVSITVWVRFARHRPDEGTDRPLLNRRMAQLVGREGVLDQPIAQGVGRLALGDTIWRISGPDLPAGQRVRVVGGDGPVLRVEPVAAE